MKRQPFFLFLSAFLLCARAGAAPLGPELMDPTQMAAPMADALKNQLATFRTVRLAGLVSADGTNGVALLRAGGREPVLARPGDELTLEAAEVTFRVRVEEVSERGVSLRAEGLEEAVRLPGALGAGLAGGGPAGALGAGLAGAGAGPAGIPGAGPGGAAGCLRHVEFDSVPLRTALLMLADQGRRNYVCSEEAAKTSISLFLRGLPPAAVVEELCKSHALWYADRDDGRKSVRILTMREFQENLSGFQQEEMSETFVLLYPNVTEVASILQGLYADRVLLSLGDEDVLDDDIDDLSRRFRRYDTINRAANSELMGEFSVQNSYGGGAGGGRRGGVYSLNRAGGFDRILGKDAAELRELRAPDAARIQEAIDRPAASNRVSTLLDTYRNRLPPVYVTVSRRNNMLIVRTCDPRVMEDIRGIVRQVDKPTPMVLLDVKLLELTLGDELNTVFDYNYSLNGDFDFNGGSRRVGAYPAAAKPALGDSMSFQVVNRHFRARIQALQDRGRARVVATPMLLTANNEVSQLFIGKEVPITRRVSSQTVVTEKNVVTAPETETEFKRVGVQLLVTPSINADRTVMLRLLQQSSDVVADGGRIPVVNPVSGETSEMPVDVVESRYVAGTFVAKDRMAIAVGGLIREEEEDSRSGIPFLMDIPYLGWFFRRTTKMKRRTELLILITPHVISTPSEGGGASARVLRANSRNPDVNPYLDEKDRLPLLKDWDGWKVKPEAD